MSCGVGRRYSSDLALLWHWLGGGYSSDSTPSLGTSICLGVAPEKAKKTKKQKKEKVKERSGKPGIEDFLEQGPGQGQPRDRLSRPGVRVFISTRWGSSSS